jgi:hypothetical protein
MKAIKLDQRTLTSPRKHQQPVRKWATAFTETALRSSEQRHLQTHAVVLLIAINCLYRDNKRCRI